MLRELSARVKRPFTFNQLAGGKSPARSLQELRRAGISLVIYSTPCLFAAQGAIDEALQALRAAGDKLPEPGPGVVGLQDCWTVLNDNLARRHGGPQAPPERVRSARTGR